MLECVAVANRRSNHSMLATSTCCGSILALGGVCCWRAAHRCTLPNPTWMRYILTPNAHAKDTAQVQQRIQIFLGRGGALAAMHQPEAHHHWKFIETRHVTSNTDPVPGACLASMAVHCPSSALFSTQASVHTVVSAHSRQRTQGVYCSQCTLPPVSQHTLFTVTNPCAFSRNTLYWIEKTIAGGKHTN